MALFLAPGIAAADVTVINFNAGGFSGFVDLTTSGPPSATGSLVTSITGDINGFTDVAIVPVNGFASNDNLLYGATAYVDIRGIAFSFNGGSEELALFGNTNNGVKPLKNPYNDPGLWGGALLCLNNNCTVSNSPLAAGAPEPATWALMLAGFGGLGAALRMARRKSQPALAKA